MNFSSLLFLDLSLIGELQQNFFFLFCGQTLEISSANEIKKSESRFLDLRNSAIKLENGKMKNRLSILNFPIKIGN